MRLLFDQNLSPTLVQRLSDLYSDASHVSLVGLDRASDEAVWSYALTNDYIIVTKDADFSDASVVRASRQGSYGSGWATAGRFKSKKRSAKPTRLWFVSWRTLIWAS